MYFDTDAPPLLAPTQQNCASMHINLLQSPLNLIQTQKGLKNLFSIVKLRKLMILAKKLRYGFC